MILLGIVSLMLADQGDQALVWLIFRDRKNETFRSKMSVTAAKIGMAMGVVVAVLFEVVPFLYHIFGGGVIPAITVTSAGMLIANCFCKDQTWKKTN